MTLLIRVEPLQSMNRWYRVAVQPTLFHPWAVVLTWGSRETTYQQVRYIPVASREEGEALAADIVAAKRKRGYRDAATPVVPPAE